MRQNKILIVDGYNVINDWDKLGLAARDDLAAARSMLIEQLSEYGAFTGTSVIVVFDAYKHRGQMERKESIHGVEVFYTKLHQTADSFIEKRTAELAASRRNSVSVATSDGAEQQIVLGKGASRISSRELLLEVERIHDKLKQRIEKGEGRKSFLEDALDPEVYEALEKWREKKD